MSVTRHNRTTRDEGGQIFPALLVVVLALVAFTLFAIVPLGSGADKRAEATTSADAAALAAVGKVHGELLDLDGLTPPGLGGSPDDGDALASILGDLDRDACGRADQFAGYNDGDLRHCRVWVDFPYVRARTVARTDERVAETDLRPEADATAEMEILGGLCPAPGGLGVGLLLDDGDCLSMSDLDQTPSPDPSPTRSPRPGDPTPAPPEPAPGLAEIVLGDPVLID